MIVIFTPCHKDFLKVERQISNYNKFFSSSEVIHILHVAKDAADVKDKYYEIESRISNVLICTGSFTTSQYCTLGASISCTKEVISRGIRPDFIYIHTDSDLIYMHGATQYIRAHKNAYEKYTTTIMKDDWYWMPRIKKDPIFNKFFDYLGLNTENINIGRQEGSFFSWETWIATTSIITTHYNEVSFFSNTSLHWPVEECLLPTVINQILKIEPSCKNLIHTKITNGISDRSDFITLDDINEFKSINGKFGAKWFSPTLTQELREMLL